MQQIIFKILYFFHRASRYVCDTEHCFQSVVSSPYFVTDYVTYKV